MSHQTTIAFQGTHGSYHEMALQALATENGLNAAGLPCPTFKAVLAAFREKKADTVVIALENNSMGRVTDAHNLLADFYGAGLRVSAEHYLPIHHCLMACEGETLGSITDVYSQEPALSQCTHFMHTHSLLPHPTADTAGAAKMVAKRQLKGAAAIASKLAAAHYGLSVLAEPINDNPNNITRFVLLQRPEAMQAHPQTSPSKTTLLFTTRHMPAALYKALGGFATNGLNLSRLESHTHGGESTFYADVEGHLDAENMQNALEELHHFCTDVKVLGCYAKQG